MISKYLLILISILLIFSACEEKNTDNFQVIDALAVPDGTYTITPPKCKSTNDTPDYISATRGAKETIGLLLDFDNLQTTQLTLANNIETRVLEDADCKISISHYVAENKGNTYQYTNAVTYRWEPENCEFSKEIGVNKYTFNSSSPEEVYINNSDNTTADVYFTVSSSRNTYILETPSYNITEFGCGKKDSLVQTLTSESTGF